MTDDADSPDPADATADAVADADATDDEQGDDSDEADDEQGDHTDEADDSDEADVAESDAAEEASGGVPDPSDGLTDPRENVPPAEAPTVESPSVGVDVPEPPSPEEVPEGLRAEFWELVITFNVALFALALGAMLVGFQGNETLGGLAIAVGVLAFAYGFYSYRTREHAP